MRPLWKHQVDAIQKAEVVPDLALFYEMGTGKTRTVIEIIRRKFAAAGAVRKTLILAPVIVCQNWKDEFALYSKINPKDILVLTKSGKDRVKQMLKECGDDLSRAKIIVTNYESMEMKDFYSLMCQWRPEIVVADEVHKCKNHESIRAKKLTAITDATAHNYILTGTPVLNSPMDLYMQFRILDRGGTFGRNFYTFRNLFFYDANAAFKSKQSYFPKWECHEKSYEALKTLIAFKSLRVTKLECLDLPPLVRTNVYVEMSSAQLKAYKEMYNDYITFIESQTGSQAVVAQLAVTKALRLQQIVSGFAKDDQGDIHRLDCPRLKALGNILEDITPGSKVIVWAGFHENYQMIAELCTKLGIEYTEIHGSISHKDRLDNMDRFRKDPAVRVMIANQAAAGAGINLVEASYMIYYSKNFSLEQDLQSESRNHRGGSEIHERITRIDLVCKGSIDELITDALANKQNVADKILSWKEKMIC